MIPAAIALEDRVSERDRACSDVRERQASARHPPIDKSSLFVEHAAHRFPNQHFGELEGFTCGQSRHRLAANAQRQVFGDPDRCTVVHANVTMKILISKYKPGSWTFLPG